MNFKSFGLAPPLLKQLDKQGFNEPTPIQLKSIPVILNKKDMIGLSQTGTGKTAAFVLPLISLLYVKEQNKDLRHVKILIISPTRELAQQIGEVTKSYASATNLKSSVLVGGVSILKQFEALKKGADIIIGTPGRIEDHIKKRTIDLRKINFVVLDEADQMLDIGFLPSIKRILNNTPTERQTLLFSATMPEGIKKLISQFMNKAIEISVSNSSKPIEKIRQKVIILDNNSKINALRKILIDRHQARILVFTRTKHGADKIVKILSKDGVFISSIHSNKSQNQREKALSNFKKGSYPVLIATDIAARGIDVKNVEVVINFDLPESPELYIHRIGRTARAGASGDAISFCSEDELKKLKIIEKLIKSNIDAFNYDGTPFINSFSKTNESLSKVFPNKGNKRNKNSNYNQKKVMNKLKLKRKLKKYKK